MNDPAGSQFRPGTTVSGYRVEALIGRGGMGVVYRASDEGLGRKVALKVIAPELASDERFRERFLRESRIAASLDHPHVVPIYQSGEDGGLLFIAMRYVEGTDLAKLLSAEGALESRRALALLSQVAEALDAAHAKGLVHRDVKPSNVLIAEGVGSEHCYLADFGLTRRTGSVSGISAAGEIVGTLDYVAPEQITGDAPDARSDVYSLGCVLYECLTGQTPFPRATDVALLWAHVHEEPTGPSDIRPELSQELDSAVARALAKNPEERYRSAGELVEACSVSGPSAAQADGAMPPTNLPRPLSSFVGRGAELAEVRARLEGGARLLTLTGPGGSGKTRLALAIASSLVSEYEAGVVWVGLSALRDPSLVTETIAQTLGAKDGLSEHIAEREMLLVIDNLEQVIESAPALASFLERCPNLKLLVTSRELLHVQGEVEYEVPPLASPEAVTLFCARSRLEPSAEIIELCSRVDDLPLAVELAAGRAKALSPAQILERLAPSLDLLKGGRDADPRQQTLRATIKWSYDLLSEGEQRLFRALSVFRGGCTLEAAEEVADASLDIIQSLVEKSLLRYSNERYGMLETIREYAGEAVEPDAMRALRNRHAYYFCEFVERAEPELERHDQSAWLDVIAREHDNIREALEWSFSSEDTDVGARLASSLPRFWSVRGHAAEGRRWLARALATNAGSDPTLESSLLRATGLLAFDMEDFEEVRQAATRRLELAREAGDQKAVAGCLNNLGILAGREGEYAAASILFQDSLAILRELGERRDVVHPLTNLAWTMFLEDEFERSHSLALEALELARECGDIEQLADINGTLAWISLNQDDLGAAVVFARELTRNAAQLQDEPAFRECSAFLTIALTRTGNLSLAAELAGKLHYLREEAGVAPWIPGRDKLFTDADAKMRRGLGEEVLLGAMRIGREADLMQLLESGLLELEAAASAGGTPLVPRPVEP